MATFEQIKSASVAAQQAASRAAASVSAAEVLVAKANAAVEVSTAAAVNAEEAADAAETACLQAEADAVESKAQADQLMSLVLAYDPVPVPVPPQPQPPIPATYWTPIVLGSLAKAYFVSSSLGADSNDGLTPAKPLKTAAAGLKKLRTGAGDHLYFRCGDVWLESLGNWNLSGLSSSQPVVVASYGVGVRPLFKTGGGDFLSATGSGGAAEKHSFVRIIGLAAVCHKQDPKDPAFTGLISDAQGLRLRRGLEDWIIEDCTFAYYNSAATITDSDGKGQRGVKFRRCQELDSYCVTGAHSQGFYFDGLREFTVDGNLIDHCGWSEDPKVRAGTGSKGAADVYSHALYGSNHNGGWPTPAMPSAPASPVSGELLFTGNIVLQPSSHGCQARAGGEILDSFFWRCAIGPLLGGGDQQQFNPGGVVGGIRRCVVLEGRDIESAPKAYGIGLENIRDAECTDNVVANALVVTAHAPLPLAVPGVRYARNITYNWPKTGSPVGTYPDPTRSLAAYDKFLGGLGTTQGMIDRLRAQSKQAWDKRLEAVAINVFINEGFGR